MSKKDMGYVPSGKFLLHGSFRTGKKAKAMEALHSPDEESLHDPVAEAGFLRSGRGELALFRNALCWEMDLEDHFMRCCCSPLLCQAQHGLCFMSFGFSCFGNKESWLRLTITLTCVMAILKTPLETMYSITEEEEERSLVEAHQSSPKRTYPITAWSELQPAAAVSGYATRVGFYERPVDGVDAFNGKPSPYLGIPVLFHRGRSEGARMPRLNRALAEGLALRHCMPAFTPILTALPTVSSVDEEKLAADPKVLRRWHTAKQAVLRYAWLLSFVFDQELIALSQQPPSPSAHRTAMFSSAVFLSDWITLDLTPNPFLLLLDDVLPIRVSTCYCARANTASLSVQRRLGDSPFFSSLIVYSHWRSDTVNRQCTNPRASRNIAIGTFSTSTLFEALASTRCRMKLAAKGGTGKYSTVNDTIAESS
ncbi:hypothetical protein BKA70DRAFT_1237639 [Coprinopsis sp. MPI-PUGE-AT-0042]|nr:hypothetical protein BKA70DRAFT_1237639 [Coprinopsis sp. MPI-PUGE-AT-0042]